MTAYNSFSEWNDLIKKLIQKGRSVAIGIFNKQGQLLEGNQAMFFYLDAAPGNEIYGNTFVNPDFFTLSENKQEGQIFAGLLTIGNEGQISYTLETEIFRKNDHYLVFAEADIQHLFTENKMMSRLNQEVNNLQRQLMKEKLNLQRTLQELKETQQMLVHSEKMNAMGKLVAGVAHELNNPIAFVYSNMFSLENYINEISGSFNEMEELIKKKGDQDLNTAVSEIKKKNDLDYITNDLADLTTQTKTGLNRVKTIVEDLRKFSRLDEAEMKTVDLVENLKSTVAIANMEFSKKDIHTEFHFPEKLMVECYPSQLNQALLNVIVNAAQAIDKKGNILISISEKGDFIQLVVEDNGCGIPENLKSKIFDPFFTTKPIGSGTGLGLSITYKIITDMHKGEIKLESEVGKGTRFIIIIPGKQ